MRVRVSACVRACVSACMSACVCVCARGVRVCPACVSTCVRVCARVCVHVCACVRARDHIPSMRRQPRGAAMVARRLAVLAHHLRLTRASPLMPPVRALSATPAGKGMADAAPARTLFERIAAKEVR